MLVGLMGAGRGILQLYRHSLRDDDGEIHGGQDVRLDGDRQKETEKGASRSDQAIPRGVHAKNLGYVLMEPDFEPAAFLQCAFVIILCLVFELNAFFLKYVLWIPPPHVLNHIRLALWFGMANVATREYYVFITSRQGMTLTKMGANAWLTIAVALVEICLLYTSPSPRDRTRSRMPSSA